MLLVHLGMLDGSCLLQLLQTATVEVVPVHAMCPGVRCAFPSLSGGTQALRVVACGVLCSADALLHRSVYSGRKQEL
jgi:hypothetical protein